MIERDDEDTSITIKTTHNDMNEQHVTIDHHLKCIGDSEREKVVILRVKSWNFAPSETRRGHSSVRMRHGREDNFPPRLTATSTRNVAANHRAGMLGSRGHAPFRKRTILRNHDSTSKSFEIVKFRDCPRFATVSFPIENRLSSIVSISDGQRVLDSHGIDGLHSLISMMRSRAYCPW